MEIRLGSPKNPIPSHQAFMAIGATAREILDATQEAKVLGRSTRGIFLACDSERVVFLSKERYRGPLTFNLPAAPWSAEGLYPGLLVQVRSQSLYFPSTGGVISYRTAPIWRPPVPKLDRLEISCVGDRLARLVELVLNDDQSGGASLLADAADFARTLAYPTGAPDHQNSTRDELERLASSLALYLRIQTGSSELRKAAQAELAEATKAFLGRGRGLTPSGDDLILGIALSLARWETLFVTGLEQSARVEAWLPALAARTTTALSAGLIACACQGQADERLILALDSLMTGETNLIKCARGLLSWGSSSGSDFLAGILLAVTAGARVLFTEAEYAGRR